MPSALRAGGRPLPRAIISADLGSSSNESSETLNELVGLSGEGFREQVGLPRLSRPLGGQETPVIGKAPDREPERQGGERGVATLSSPRKANQKKGQEGPGWPFPLIPSGARGL